MTACTRWTPRSCRRVRVRGLRKSYGAHEAVRGIDFEIPRRRGVRPARPERRRQDDDRRDPRGLPRPRRRRGRGARRGPPAGASRAWRERLGVVLQSSSLYANLTPRESLALFAGYYQRPRDVDEVIEIVGLEEKADARVRTLSGGQKRRLDLGLALVGDPELIFLDEPTTGFDPAARRAAWETIRNLRSLGTTVLLTTHYLDEAEQLADRVAVLARRRDRPRGLAGRADRRERRDRDPLPPRRRGDRRAARRPDAAPARADRRGARRGEELEGLEVRRPTLEDVYLELTADEVVAARAAHAAAPLLAKPRGGVLHLLPAGRLLPHPCRRRSRRRSGRRTGGRKNVKIAASRLRQKSSCSVRSSCSEEPHSAVSSR